MKKHKLLISLAIATFASVAMAEDAISYSFSLKDWYSKAKVGSTSSESTNSPIVSATARKGDYFVTASTLLSTTYSFGSGSELFRKDADLALGWSVHPNVSLLLGQKNAGIREYNTSKGWTNYGVNLTYLGANGFTSIGEKSFVYGTYTQSFKGHDGALGGTMKYTSYEGGYGYVLSKDSQLTVGYRSQKFSASDGTSTLPGIIFGVNMTP
jgi:hypothetical protein